MATSLLALGLGAVVGLILALAGAGGGILAVPLLVFGLHLSIMQAAPVGLIAVGAASVLVPLFIAEAAPPDPAILTRTTADLQRLLQVLH